MKITSKAKDPLDRVLEEGVAIKDLELDPGIDCLNSRSEYFQSEFITVQYSKGANRIISHG